MADAGALPGLAGRNAGLSWRDGKRRRRHPLGGRRISRLGRGRPRATVRRCRLDASPAQLSTQTRRRRHHRGNAATRRNPPCDGTPCGCLRLLAPLAARNRPAGRNAGRPLVGHAFAPRQRFRACGIGDGVSHRRALARHAAPSFRQRRSARRDRIFPRTQFGRRPLAADIAGAQRKPAKRRPILRRASARRFACSTTHANPASPPSQRKCRNPTEPTL